MPSTSSALSSSATPGAATRRRSSPTPTLLVRGGDDFPTALGEIYAHICERNPAAREAIIDGVGHLPPQDAPDDFNRLLAEFLDALVR